MSKMGGFSAAELKKLQQNLKKLSANDVNVFIESCAKNLAARLLAKVIKRTLPGVYTEKSGKKGGTLRRGWVSKTQEEAQSGSWKADSAANAKAAEYAKSLEINHTGNVLTIEIVNPVEYASYVEYGHRTANHKGWVQGKFMLTVSEQEIQQIAPKVLEQKLQKLLEECLT